MDGQTGGLTDDQCETIIPRHYCVAGYKKYLSSLQLMLSAVRQPQNGSIYGITQNSYI